MYAFLKRPRQDFRDGMKYEKRRFSQESLNRNFENKATTLDHRTENNRSQSFSDALQEGWQVLKSFSLY